MNLDLLPQLLPAFVAAVTAIAGLARGQRKLRSNLRHDAETMKELPDESDARDLLMTHVRWQIERLQYIEREGTRDTTTAIVSGLFAVGLGYLTFWLVIQNAWWSWTALAPGFVTFAALYALFDSAAVAKRDEKGNRIKGE